MRLTNFIIKKNLKKKKITLKFSIFFNKKKKYSQLFAEQIANNLAAKLLEASSTKKSFDRWVCLTIPAKSANLLPPIGPFLGQHGFNTLTFCNNFNNITKLYPEGVPFKTIIKLFSDKTLVFQLKTPPVSFLLYAAAANNLSNFITIKDLFKITLIKKIDLTELSFFSIYNSILGTARSMKLKIK